VELVADSLDAAPPAVRTSRARYGTYAWATLGANLLVIAWGAFVRASGSGAGCGSHWPLCNGEVVPRAPATATLIEFGHRVTSGLALLLVVGLVIGAWRRFPPGHLVRRTAAAAGVLMVLEALIGAGLVLLELVAGNASVARGIWMSGHLVNTFLLLAALALTAHSATDGRAALRRVGSVATTLGAALAAVLVLGVSGAVTALGDTLFPAATLAEGEQLTFSPSAHVFLRLRVWHPTLAVVTGLLVVAAALHAMRARATSPVRTYAAALLALFGVQLVVGIANLSLLAPVPLQLVHLLMADLVWIALVLLAAAVAADRAGDPAPQS
jgi:heme A synthase